MIEDKIATNQHQQLPIQCLPLSLPLLEASLASQVSSHDGQEEGEDPQGHFFYQEPNVRRLRFKTKAHIEGGTIWLPLKFDCLLQKEEKIISKEMSLQKKGEEIFSAEAIFQDGTTFLQLDPCMEQPSGSHSDRVFLI